MLETVVEDGVHSNLGPGPSPDGGGHDKPGALASGRVTRPGTVTELFTCGGSPLWRCGSGFSSSPLPMMTSRCSSTTSPCWTRTTSGWNPLGLSLAEAKTLLLELQRLVLSRQIAAFLAARMACPACGRTRGIKDQKTIAFQFGRAAVLGGLA